MLRSSSSDGCIEGTKPYASIFLKRVNNFKHEELGLIGETATIAGFTYKLLHVNPATSASVELLFSIARRLTTWLRSNIQQTILNDLAMFSYHKRHVDMIFLLETGITALESLRKQIDL